MTKRIALIATLASLVAPTTAQAWPTWGNLESGDCAFAAAANWELLHHHTTATEASVVSEYQAVSPKDEGISGDELVSYWHTHGIAGRRERVRTADPEHLRRVMRRHGAVIAEFAVPPGQRWDTVVDTKGGIHFVVVRWTNRRGPIILTWGKLAQMTWWQWREDGVLLYTPVRL